MKKEDFIKNVDDAGDAIITYRSQNSRRLKYNVCTMDFDNKYIQSKRNRAKPSNSQVLLFCWDTDSFRLLQPSNVTSIVPLARILRNDRVT
tara:strand:+ start:270 stop:542 length:273 start_codon:yes stop_codon:yes gene_type:complete